MKQILMPLLLLSMLIASCNNAQKPAEDEVIQQKNINVAKQLYIYFNQHDWKGMASLYVDSAEFLDPSFGTEPVKQTRSQIQEKYTQLQQSLPDIKDDVINIYPAGKEDVIVEFVSTGTLPDGNKMKLPICSILKIRNGVIISDRTYYNNAQ